MHGAQLTHPECAALFGPPASRKEGEKIIIPEFHRRVGEDINAGGCVF